MQTRFQTDDRFRVDERFLDDQPKKKLSKREQEIQEKERKKIRKQLENWDRDHDEIEQEKEKQLSILDSITGIARAPKNPQQVPQKTMLRYDPSKKEHQKYLEQPKSKVPEENIEEMELDQEQNQDENQQPFVVSDSTFYQVSSNLKDSIQQNSVSKPFSIFGMLGISHKDESDEEYKEKEITKKKKFDIQEVKFKYDSSETDEEAEEGKSKKKKVANQRQKKGGKFSKSGVWGQNFFVAEDDERLKGEFFSFLLNLFTSE
jgi:hypothetical protein